MKKRLFCLALLCAFAALLAVHAATASVIPGDLTGDGNVNRKDLAMLSKYLRNKEANPLSEKALLAVNLNGDKDVNRKDLAILSKHLRNPELYPLS